MATTSSDLLTDTYQKLVDTAVTGFTLQNRGDGEMEVVFTDSGTAPVAGVAGLVIPKSQGVNRTHGTGHVYARYKRAPASYALVVEA